VCDEHTWTALVEASWELGDRLIFLTSPNLRGDDVATLQSMLGRLGFDSGRVDGIFGPTSAKALTDFQSNCGVTADGVCGPDTARTLTALCDKSGSGPVVALIRERERLRDRLGPIGSRRVVVGHFGGLSVVNRDVTLALRSRGATVLTLSDPDAITQAERANRFEAHVYVGFEASPELADTVVYYYRVPSFESPSGLALAELVAARLADTAFGPVRVSGMRLPILRETRMPAVLVVFGAVRDAVDSSTLLGEVVSESVAHWATGRA